MKKIQWMRKPPVFQKDGPYEEISARHVKLEYGTGMLYLGLLLPMAVYFITRKPVFFMIALVYFTAIAVYKLSKERELFSEYTTIQQKTWRSLQSAIAEKTGSPEAKCSFGYRYREEDFEPVFLLENGDELEVYENIFIKQCTFGAQSNMLYLLDLKENALDMPLAEYALSEIRWEDVAETHQEMLRSEGIRLNKYLVIENVIYGLILEEMKKGKKKQILSMKAAMTDIRREKMFHLLPEKEDSMTILLPESARKTLGLN